MTAASLANEFVADTVSLVTHITKRRLGATAKSIFESVVAGNAIVDVPAMALAEILYLSERNKIPISILDVYNYLDRMANCKEYPMSLAVIKSAAEINDIPELHDRLIAGTARLLNLSLITNDRVMEASSFVKTIW